MQMVTLFHEKFPNAHHNHLIISALVKIYNSLTIKSVAVETATVTLFDGKYTINISNHQQNSQKTTQIALTVR